MRPAFLSVLMASCLIVSCDKAEPKKGAGISEPASKVISSKDGKRNMVADEMPPPP